jgi:penicillin-binding protein 1A
MEKVYADPKSGYTYGPFPKPWVKISKQYDCPSPRIRDTLEVDSLMEIPYDTLQTEPVPVPAITP